MSENELVDDLNMLWCVELRSPDPYCPIDLSYEGGEIMVSQAESMDRPLRLGTDEASALLIGLRMLAELPGPQDTSALRRTIAKLEAAAGEAAAASAQVAVQMDGRAPADLQVQVAEAMRQGTQLHLSYYVPGRDEATERDVDPMRLLLLEGRTYLEAWCRRAEAVRLFRLDRVLALTVLDVAAEVPDGAEHLDVDSGLFRPSPDDMRVELELAQAGRWVAEYYPCEEVSRTGRRPAQGGAADARHPLGQAAGAAARRGRQGDPPADLVERGRGGSDRRAGPVRVSAPGAGRSRWPGP